MYAKKMVKISCAVIVQLIITIIFDPYSGLQIRVCIGKLFYISHLNQAGVSCSLTNSTGKFDFNPKHMLRVLKRTSSFEHPKHMLKLMCKKIIKNLRK